MGDGTGGTGLDQTNMYTKLGTGMEGQPNRSPCIMRHTALLPGATIVGEGWIVYLLVLPAYD